MIYRIIRNERGMTLVELLAALTIFIILIGIVYGILISIVQNMEHRKEQEDARREVNYILTLLTNIHQKSSYYEIQSIDHTRFEIRYIFQGEEKIEQIVTAPYEWELIINGQSLQDKIAIDTKKENQLSIHVSLTLTNHDKRFDEVKIETIISRMTPAKGGEDG